MSLLTVWVGVCSLAEPFKLNDNEGGDCSAVMMIFHDGKIRKEMRCFFPPTAYARWGTSKEKKRKENKPT